MTTQATTQKGSSAMRTHTYMGTLITPYSGRFGNVAGFRWQAYVSGMFVYADTLAGMRELIRRANH